jgi:HAD domain in Swiss Army Knife RNA repair proteins
MEAKEQQRGGEGRETPLLMVDIDGVISLFGGWGSESWPSAGRQAHGAPGAAASARAGAGAAPVDGRLHSIDGIPHFLSSTAAAHLLDLSAVYELVWASGWEERANEHLPRLLGLPRGLPFLRFPRTVGRSNAHWKLEAIDAYARGRALAWVDDALNDACHAWARERAAPTLLVATEPALGLTAAQALRLERWARELRRA